MVVTTKKNVENKTHADSIVITVHFLPMAFSEKGIETTINISTKMCLKYKLSGLSVSCLLRGYVDEEHAGVSVLSLK